MNQTLKDEFFSNRAEFHHLGSIKRNSKRAGIGISNSNRKFNSSWRKAN